MPLDKDQQEYLREHLPYMLKMVRYGYAQMLERQHYLSFNAHFESFAANVRNLVNFLANKDTNNHKAGQFVPGYRARTGDLGQKMRKLDEQVFHLSKDRPSNIVGKFNTDDAKDSLEWVETNFADFLSRLPVDAQNLFNADKANPAYDQGFTVTVGPVEYGKAAACTASPIIATSSPSKAVEGPKVTYKITGAPQET